LNSGNLANIFNGNVIGSASASNIIGSTITFGQVATKQFQPFAGTVVINSSGTLRFSATGVVGGWYGSWDIETSNDKSWREA